MWYAWFIIELFLKNKLPCSRSLCLSFASFCLHCKLFLWVQLKNVARNIFSSHFLPSSVFQNPNTLQYEAYEHSSYIHIIVKPSVPVSLQLLFSSIISSSNCVSGLVLPGQSELSIKKTWIQWIIAKLSASFPCLEMIFNIFSFLLRQMKILQHSDICFCQITLFVRVMIESLFLHKISKAISTAFVLKKWKYD